MAKINLSKSTAEYTRSYDRLRGVDFCKSSPGNAGERFGYLENMYIDYEAGDAAVESIPGYRRLYDFGNRINAVHSHKIGSDREYIIVHAGDKLYRFNSKNRDSLSSLSPIATLADTRSHSFLFGRDLYLGDGEKILRISESGEVTEVGEGSSPAPYVPTLYIDGLKYEARNLLTNEFREIHSTAVPLQYRYGTPSLAYEVIDESLKTCAVTGAKSLISGILYVPSYATIGNDRYKITEISELAFSNRQDITGFVANNNLVKICASAFLNCNALRSVILSSSVREIESLAFASCDSLAYIYLNKKIETISNSAFSNSSRLTDVDFGGSEEAFAKIDGYAAIRDKVISYSIENKSVTVGVPVYGDVSEVTSLTLGDVPQSFAFDAASSTVIFQIPDINEEFNSKLIVSGLLKDTTAPDNGGDFLSTSFGKNVTPKEAITGCTVSEIFDGRIFLSGHPNLGGTVFYSGKDKGGNISPLYFPSDNFFIDGLGSYTVTSLLSSNGSLVVFKSGDEGGGSIFYHSVKSTSQRTEYPILYSHFETVARGDVRAFLDDALFLCGAGVCTLKKVSENDYSELLLRSSNVNSYLLKENLDSARMTEWRGYFVIAIGTHIYLADSRETFKKNGNKEYTWYYLSGVGSYKNDTRVYRYAQSAPDGFLVCDKVDEVASGTVMSVAGEGGEMIYFVVRDGSRYVVYPTEEFSGGSLSGIVAVRSLGELLYFATEDGGLFVFNNDKRGVAPPVISDSADFDYSEYRRLMGDKIHPYFYSFDRHAPRYAVSTKMDDCDIPHLRKSTVRDSLVVKIKAYPKSRIKAAVRCDSSGYESIGDFSASSYDFSDFDFSLPPATLGDFSIIAIPERERGWIEKEILLYSEDYASPIGISSIAYRYKIKGKIKTH